MQGVNGGEAIFDTSITIACLKRAGGWPGRSIITRTRNAQIASATKAEEGVAGNGSEGGGICVCKTRHGVADAIGTCRRRALSPTKLTACIYQKDEILRRVTHKESEVEVSYLLSPRRESALY